MEKWREDLYLSHHGILGMSWGKKNGPPYPLGAEDHSAAEKKAGWMKSLSSKAKELKSDISKKRAKAKRAKQLKKARAAKAKKEEERKKAEALAADRDRALKYGTASEVMRYKKQISRQEAKEIRDRLNDMAAIEAYYKQEKESKSAWHKLDKVMKRVDQARDWAEKGTKAWNTFAKISNSLFDTELRQISDNPLKQDNNKKNNDDDDDDSAMREVLKLLKQQNNGKGNGDSGNKKEKPVKESKNKKSSGDSSKKSETSEKSESTEQKTSSTKEKKASPKQSKAFDQMDRVSEKAREESAKNSLYRDSQSGQDRARANSEYLSSLVNKSSDTPVSKLYEASAASRRSEQYLNSLVNDHADESVSRLYEMSSAAQDRARATNDYLNELLKKG